MDAGAELDVLLDELTDLAASAPRPSDFYKAILTAILQSTPATAAALWSVSGSSYRLEAASGLTELGIETNVELQCLHEQALAECCQDRFHRQLDTAKQLAPSPSTFVEQAFEDHLYRFLACRDRGRAFLAIEIVLPRVASDEGQFQLRLLTALGEIVGDFYGDQLLEEYELKHHLFSDLHTIVQRMHAARSLVETASEIANEGRRFLECDRVTVLRCDSGRGRALAVSGVATLERRAKQLRDLECLCDMVALTGKALHFPSRVEHLPDHETLLQQYLDSSGSEQLSIYPLTKTRPDHVTSSDVDEKILRQKRPLGAIVIENFVKSDRNVGADALESPTGERRELYLQQARIAFENAIEFDSLPLLGWSRRLRKLQARFPTYGLNALAIAVLLAIMTFLAWLIPAELNIEAKGVYQPMDLRHIYAPMLGEIVQVMAAHQSPVQAGETLIVMRSRDLELKKEELLTQRSVTFERLRGIESARFGDRKQSSVEPLSAMELSASERELREVLASQEKQLKILQQMLESLTIVSPISGQIISWNPSETLERRPVQQGQRLMSVAELSSEGRLELRVRDSDIRHVLQAHGAPHTEPPHTEPPHTEPPQSSTTVPVRISFAIATDPGRQHQARLIEVGTLSETLTSDGATVRVEAAVQAQQMRGARPGATVLARIHCGKCSIGYIWTRRLWDYLLLHWLPAP